jgi:hypothetical protein
VLIEGPEIEPLLAQIREEYGPDARIVSADKVRSGGVAGFFTKQHYEIAVEVDDGEDPPTAGRPPLAGAARTQAPGPAPVTLLDLVEARRDRFEGAGEDAAGRGDATPDEVPAHGSQAPADGDAEAITALPPRAGLVSTTGASFADVMAGLRADGLAAAVRPETGAAPLIDADPDPDATPGSGPDRDATPVVRPYRPAVVPPGSAPVVPAVTTDSGAAPAPMDDISTATGADTRTASPTAYVGASTAVPHGEPSAPWAEALLALGLPVALAAKAHGSDPYQAALRAFAGSQLPPAAPGRPGDILVLVGEVGRALPLALRLAEGLRLDRGEILLAAATSEGTSVDSSGRISGPADAERRARRMHRADTPHLVVVDAPIDDTDPQWVRDVCDALGATGVWGVVDATRKTADTARLLSGFGKVDAIAAYAVRACGDPASMLAIGPPVALIDGRPATAHAWAALLSERLLSTVEVGHGTR